MCFEKVSCMVTYIVKIKVWNDSQTMWNSFQTFVLMQKTCLIYVSGICHACTRSCLCAACEGDSCVHTARVSLALLFQK